MLDFKTWATLNLVARKRRLPQRRCSRKITAIQAQSRTNDSTCIGRELCKTTALKRGYNSREPFPKDPG